MEISFDEKFIKDFDTFEVKKTEEGHSTTIKGVIVMCASGYFRMITYGLNPDYDKTKPTLDSQDQEKNNAYYRWEATCSLEIESLGPRNSNLTTQRNKTFQSMGLCPRGKYVVAAAYKLNTMKHFGMYLIEVNATEKTLSLVDFKEDEDGASTSNIQALTVPFYNHKDEPIVLGVTYFDHVLYSYAIKEEVLVKLEDFDQNFLDSLSHGFVTSHSRHYHNKPTAWIIDHNGVIVAVRSAPAHNEK